MRFTPAQEQAITARNRELLVSAAAGSGKTAVLVERIVRMIAEDGLSIDRMLIVTFTRAAASEMRERLETRLADAANGDARLQRQADLVASAQISTIHSFCQHTVREHFQHCGIDPQFGLCDERMRQGYYEEAMQETLDAVYSLARTDDDLKALTGKFPERDLEAMMDMVYRFILSRPDPLEWMHRHAGKQWSMETLDDEPMALAFCEEAKLMAEGMLTLWHQANEAALDPCFPPLYVKTLQSDGLVLRDLLRACQQGMTALLGALRELKFARLGVFKPTTTDEEQAAEQFKNLRSRWKDMADELKKLLPEDCGQAISDLQAMVPAARGLDHAVTLLHESFTEKKKRDGVIDFGDLEHMTLSILRTPQLQKQLSQRFDAIFVDEYQDVSELQEAILNGLKRPADNPAKQYAFYVGDVKQSIYRFRLAEPGLFLGKLNRFSPDADAPERKIVLNRNFRSKTAVLDAVNRIFEHVMDGRVTEIDYDEDAHLIPGVPSTGDPMTEVHILNSDDLRPQEQVLAEAEWIARDIEATVGTPIVDGEGHECGLLHYRDIAILLPVSKNIADKVELALTRHGIPVYCEGSGDAMASDEITQTMQYLTLLDNLMNDVALISVLRSPLFEMTESELSAIRLTRPEREASFLTALYAAAEEADEPLRARCRQVLDMLKEERFYLSSMPLAEYLWDFLGRSGLYAHYGAQPGGKLRQANLRMLCHRAADWEQNHTDGLSGFAASLLADGGSESSPTVINPWEDVVRVMTIHKSKGLEFPTVYVMNMGRAMFGRASTRAVSVHGAVGMGIGYVNENARTKRTTLLQSAITLREKNAERAERARVLYVALTRPKSRLVMVGSASEKAAGVEALRQQARSGSDVYAVRQAHSMLDWVLQSLQPSDCIEEFSTYVEWKTCGEPRLSTQSTCFPHKSAPWRVVFHINPDVTHRESAEKPLSSFHIDVPQSAVQPVSGVQPRRAGSEDPIAPRLDHALHLPLKVGVTALCRAIEQGFPHAVDEDEETAETKRFPLASAQPRLLSSLPALPAFMAPPEEEQAIQRGVATHRALCMISLAEIRKHVENPKALYACICREIETLSERGVLTEQETEWADRRMIARWFESDLGRRMLAAQTIQREWSFNLRVSEPFPTMVQGVIDLCFVENGAWVLVDFKTDRVSDVQQLLPRYRRQMDYYRQALQAGTALPVKESILFSLRLGQGAEAAQP